MVEDLKARKSWDFPKRRKLQFVWWFPQWCGLGVQAWGGAAACMFRPSIALGFLEIRRWRPKPETMRLFDAYRRQCEAEDALEQQTKVEGEE
jgi:hypothetical protein